MMFRLLIQTAFALGLLQAYPPDAGVVEQRARLPQAADRPAPAGVYEALALAQRPLPMAHDARRGPVKVDPTSIGVATSAVSAIVVDRETGETLFEKNTDVPRSIGSITKLMTAYVFLQGEPDLNARASVRSEDVRLGGIQHVAVGDDVRVRDLLEASLVASDNSATASLVRLSGLSHADFIARMNETAAEMGLRATTFVDEAGLSPENRSIAPDVARMLHAILDVELIRAMTEQSHAVFTSASGRTYELSSTNELLGGFLNEPPYRIVGGKTGYLPEAGYCFGAVFDKDGGGEIIVVVLGSDSRQGRFQDAKALAAWAYKVFDWPHVSR